MKLFDLPISKYHTDLTSFFIVDSDYQPHAITKNTYMDIDSGFFNSRNRAICCYVDERLNMQYVLVDKEFNIVSDFYISIKRTDTPLFYICTKLKINHKFKCVIDENDKLFHSSEDDTVVKYYKTPEILKIFTHNSKFELDIFYNKYGKLLQRTTKYTRVASNVLFTNEGMFYTCVNKFGITKIVHTGIEELDVLDLEAYFNELCPKKYDYIFYKLLGQL